MLNLDFVCFGVLRAVELCSVQFRLMKLWKNFHRKIGWSGEPRFGWLGIQHVIMKLPPSWGDKMSNVVEGKRKTHWREGWTSQTTARQSLNVAVAWCLPGGISSTTLANCCSANTSWTCRGCFNARRRPRRSTWRVICNMCSMVRVELIQPSRLHPACTAHLANQTSFHKLLLQGPKLCWGGISGSLSRTFRLLQPSVRPKLVPVKIYLLCSSRSASTVFPLGCCSIYTLTCLSSDYG